MEHKLGRLIDHLHLFSGNFEASKVFYRAVLKALGREFITESAEHFSSDELYVTPILAPGTQPSYVHFAFQAPDREAVQRFYAAGLSAGGRDNGAPGERAQYHPGYYGAFLRDPDGNNVEAVFHGAATRSADAIVITPL